MRWWFAAMLIAGCTTPKHFGPCNDTLTCQAQQRERDREFARLVAEEPLAARLDVESVSGLLHDRQRHVLYVTAPTLLALDVSTGQELWRNDAVKGTLARAGRWLVASELTAPKLGVTVHFVDVTQVTRPLHSCALPLSLHRMANGLGVEVFDRAGKPQVYWSSWWHYGGGTPPPDDLVAEGRAARGCGVLSVEPTSCASEEVSLRGLLFDPPANVCDVSAGYAMPAAAASRVPPMPADGNVSIRVLRQPERQGVTALVLEVRDASGAVKWVRRLGEEHEEPNVP